MQRSLSSAFGLWDGIWEALAHPQAFTNTAFLTVLSGVHI